MSSRRRTFRFVVAGISLVAVLFLFIFPARTYLAQRRSLSDAATRVDVLSKENTKLSQQAQQLQTDAEIERLARQQYGLVKPGEQAYAILPPKSPPTTAPPKPASRHGHPGVLGRIWRDLQVWH